MTKSNGHRQTLMDAIGGMIAQLLPAPFRGLYERSTEGP
jgi:hypothetical protein